MELRTECVLLNGDVDAWPEHHEGSTRPVGAKCRDFEHLPYPQTNTGWAIFPFGFGP